MDILTIGEVLIDLTQTGKDARGIPQFAANPGGAPANLAVAAVCVVFAVDGLSRALPRCMVYLVRLLLFAVQRFQCRLWH